MAYKWVHISLFMCHLTLVAGAGRERQAPSLWLSYSRLGAPYWDWQYWWRQDLTVVRISYWKTWVNQKYFFSSSRIFLDGYYSALRYFCRLALTAAALVVWQWYEMCLFSNIRCLSFYIKELFKSFSPWPTRCARWCNGYIYIAFLSI